jgi:3-dehydroquinate dehydratase/shikimate dehydrogenase
MLDALEQAVEAGADAVELRLDYLHQAPEEKQLRQMMAGRDGVELIVTCRPRREGGRFDGPEEDRLALLGRAAELCPDFIDVEIGVPRHHWPKGSIIHSHHDFHSMPQDLRETAAALDASDAEINKLAFASPGPEAALAALEVLRLCHKPTIALAMGESGVASRVLAKKFGAFGTFACLQSGSESAPGQPTVDQLRKLYRWDSLTPATEVYGVIGCPLGHSLSPAIHNAAFQALGMDAVYVPLHIEPGAMGFDRFMDALLERPWADFKGLSVTIPHKENALAYVGVANCEKLAVAIGAVNTIAISADGKLRGTNTDYAAAIDALVEAMGIARDDLAGRKVAVLGAGGAARAIVAALAHYRARVTIYNRTLMRARELADEFDASADQLGAASCCDSEIIINTTPVGMSPKVDASPLTSIPPAAKVVFDTIYNPRRTRLLAEAQAAGCTTVGGVEMFIGQAKAQFETWTGRPAPLDVMREVVDRELSAREAAR